MEQRIARYVQGDDPAPVVDQALSAAATLRESQGRPEQGRGATGSGRGQ
jgi:hypothetical protein